MLTPDPQTGSGAKIASPNCWTFEDGFGRSMDASRPLSVVTDDLVAVGEALANDRAGNTAQVTRPGGREAGIQR